MVPKLDVFDHTFEPPPLRGLESVWSMPLALNTVPFEDESLDRAVSCIRMYLDLKDDTEWFHVMVRTLAFPSFLRAMDADEGRSRTLSFSCWCDGGTPKEARHRQHRHMVVVSSPPGHFIKDVWKTIVPENRPYKNFRCIHLQPIRDAMHLVNTLGYLSKRTSRCNFNGDRKRPEKNNHFYLFESLPTDYRLPLVLQWDDGLLELIHQNYRNIKLGELVRSRLTFFKMQWHMKIGDVPGIILGTVLPVSREFHPCSHQTPHLLHLTRGRKMHFERNPHLCRLSLDAWLQKQTNMGNLFYDISREEYWTPRPYHQAILNEFKPVVELNRELIEELSKTRQDVSHWKANHDLLKKINRRQERKIKRLATLKPPPPPPPPLVVNRGRKRTRSAEF